MPRRIQIRMACQRCRKKRAKCDGQAPCKRCEEAGERCAYDYTRRESKDDLRAEIERLKKSNEDNYALLKAISSIKHVDGCNALIQELVEGSKSHRVILQELAQLDRRARDDASPTEPAAPTCPHCLGSLPSPMARRGSSSDVSAFAEPASTPVSLPSLPYVDGDGSQSPTDRWTRTGWSVASVRQLFDTLLTWDYLPFCLLCREPFLQDYHSGSSRYCSSALVNALLALATRAMNENDNEARTLAPGWSGSKAFFDEAEALIHSIAPSSGSLPDIQALGILALYQISCGREAEAQELAEAFASSITDLCLREPFAGADDDEAERRHVKVRATTYCGAVSLIRILRLTTGQLFDHALQDDHVVLEHACAGGRCGYGAERSANAAAPGPALHAHMSSHLCNLQLIPAKIFQLTEWVYKLLAAARLPSTQFASGEVVAVYTKCLDWYQSFFALLRKDGSDTPFMLFIHMYYQFVLLCLFRPFVHLGLTDSDIRPREICVQAAQSILALCQSYDGLFTLRRVSAFVPYFVGASGFVSLAVAADAKAARVDVPRPRLSRNGLLTVKAEPEADSAVVSPAPSPVKMSAVAHARLLLGEMSLTHPVASLAESMLRGEAN